MNPPTRSSGNRTALDRNPLLFLLFFSYFSGRKVSTLGSMSSIAVSYGEKGSVFCGLKSDGSHSPNCYGSNPAITQATPNHLHFLGLTAGSGFVCGLLMDSNQPFCWGNTNFIPMGRVPPKWAKKSQYLDISAGDNHLCGLRKPVSGNMMTTSTVDCWGYNMSKSYSFNGRILSISAGSVFNCGLFASNKSVFCWGDETLVNGKGLVPEKLKFKKIGAGGYHVCGILEEFHDTVFCRGRSLHPQQQKIRLTLSVVYSLQLNFVPAPNDPMISVVGGKFHACGIRSYDNGVVCWGSIAEDSTPPPSDVRLHTLAAGDYFTCGVSYENPLSPVCWGFDAPSVSPLPLSPSLCKSAPCPRDFYEFDNARTPCSLPGSHICLPCSKGCPKEMYQISGCVSTSDRACGYNCSRCVSIECVSDCRLVDNISDEFLSFRFPFVISDICLAVFLIIAVMLIMVLFVRCKLRNCKDNLTTSNGKRCSLSLNKVKIRKAQILTYEELERATDGFKEESLVGKGSFSCVYKGTLNDGSNVAVKKAIVCHDSIKCFKEFLTELDLLSRLNHAHLLNLLGYCAEGDERLLVYEFMSNGSLYHYLHGKNKELKKQLQWVTRLTIAVQASRGIEYLHRYACPPVIHRDIKSSNILIDEDHNARVADFGLSLLAPIDGSMPLSELPMGTLGYLDPEYYRLHYLTTKSDVYSFGVLLLEIISGRKAIDMSYEEGNIVEWAVPLIKSNDIQSVLDPVLDRPPDLEALERVAGIASKCVRMRGKGRPSMDEVTTGLERALAAFIGKGQPILPSEVVLGSSRFHRKSSQMSVDESDLDEGQRVENVAPYPSSGTSRGAGSSFSESDGDGKNVKMRNVGGDGSRFVVEEIGPGSPLESLYLQHNF
ncbi:Serine threonine-protein kinase-like protein [Orobanche hederae]